MIAIEQLRYVRLGVSDLEKSADFASRVIGLQEYGGSDEERHFRSDDRDHTLELFHHDAGSQSLAMEVRSIDNLEEATEQLEKAGYDVSQGDESACETRGVKAMISFQIRQGIHIELVVRPLHSGWRYHAPRDAGITEFFGVGIASTNIDADTKLWTEILGAKVSDYVGEAVCLSIDDWHSRIMLYPSDTDRLLEMQFQLEGLHEVMQNHYFLQSVQIPIIQGPGRRAASGQVFICFSGPDDLLFSYVAETEKLPEESRLPRQFPHSPKSFCAWGSLSNLKEFGGEG